MTLLRILRDHPREPAAVGGSSGERSTFLADGFSRGTSILEGLFGCSLLATTFRDSCAGAAMGRPASACVRDRRPALPSLRVHVAPHRSYRGSLGGAKDSRVHEAPRSRAERLIARASKEKSRGAQHRLGLRKHLILQHVLVEAAGIEKASTLMKSGTYTRNKCLKSASWTFASCCAAAWDARRGRALIVRGTTSQELIGQSA